MKLTQPTSPNECRNPQLATTSDRVRSNESDAAALVSTIQGSCRQCRGAPRKPIGQLVSPFWKPVRYAFGTGIESGNTMTQFIDDVMHTIYNALLF